MPERLAQAARAALRRDWWHPRYQGDTSKLVQELLDGGVDRFLFGASAHRGEMAQSLNYWAANVQETFAPRALGLATFHPEDAPSVGLLADEAFGKLRLAGASLYPHVGRFHLDDRRLYPLYERLVERKAVLFLHGGRRPEASAYNGAVEVASILRRYPALRLIVAHMGADEFDAFFDLCEGYEHVHLETAMVFNKHLGGPPPLERVLEYQDRVLFGSAFPFLPFSLATAIAAIRDLRLGVGLETKIFHTNAARVFQSAAL